MRYLVLAMACASLAACVSTSGVVPDGPDGYRISGAGRTGFSSSAAMQQRNYEEATVHCARMGKVVETLGADSKQARPLGGWPEANLHFRCVDRAPGAPQ